MRAVCIRRWRQSGYHPIHDIYFSLQSRKHCCHTFDFEKASNFFDKMHPFISYAIKLGYTSSDAEKALSRLGPSATTNDLLKMVISLKSTTSSRQNDLYIRGKSTSVPQRRCLGYKKQNLSHVSPGAHTSLSWKLNWSHLYGDVWNLLITKSLFCHFCSLISWTGFLRNYVIKSWTI